MRLARNVGSEHTHTFVLLFIALKLTNTSTHQHTRSHSHAVLDGWANWSCDADRLGSVTDARLCARLHGIAGVCSKRCGFR